MENGTKLIIIGGMITSLTYLLLSRMITDTYWIWFLTRAFGLMAYSALATTVFLGEIRPLTKQKTGMGIFRLHKPIAIFGLFLVLLHFISAASDNFKWGIGLHLTQFLGFSYSNKWMTLLSLGTIAAYLMLIVAVTSATKIIPRIGYGKWKIIHYLSYISMVIAFIHGALLGTDVKTSIVSPIIGPMIYISFFVVTGLMLARITHGLLNLEDQIEINLIASMFILILIGGYITISIMDHISEKENTIRDDIIQYQQNIKDEQTTNEMIQQRNINLTKQIEAIKNG